MTPQERTGAGRRRRLARRLARLVGLVLVPAALALPMAALGAGDPGAGGAGRPLPSFLLPNLLAVGMSLTVLVIACKRFRKE